jgi:hypothetical protein
MRRKNIAFLLLLLAVLIGAFVMTLGYPSRPRLFPLITICLCGLLVLMELIKAFLPGKEGGLGESEETLKTAGEKRRRFAVTTAWIGGFTLSIWLLGFVIGMPLFVLAYVRLNGEKWLWTILLPVGMFAIVYYGFGLLLETPLYEGFLFLP